MRMLKLTAAGAAMLLACSAYAGSLPIRAGGDASFPGVPQTVVAGVKAAPPTDSPTRALKPEQFTFDVASGSMLQGKASRKFMNRIVTPFTTPIVKTTSPVKLEQVGPVVFLSIAPDQADPVVLYIMEKGNELDSVALMLTPDDVGPVEIRLTQGVAAQGPTYRFNSEQAKSFEQSTPFTDTLTELMRQLAQGRVPSGYAYRAYGPDDAMPGCAQPGLRFEPRQVVEGYSLQAYVAVVTNVTGKPVEFEEQDCAHDGIAAVASWPGPLLQPGQSAEVYLVEWRERVSPGSQRRPSALGGAR